MDSACHYSIYVQLLATRVVIIQVGLASLKKKLVNCNWQIDYLRDIMAENSTKNYCFVIIDGEIALICCVR